jgi:O-acetyl-ADP-ribose deacetylase (regulator of RNase III)
MQIRYTKGDVTRPKGSGLIVHCCNDIGGWGRGLVVALSKRWPHVEQEYRRWFRGNPSDCTVHLTGPFGLGAVQFVEAQPGCYVANLIGQHDIRWHNGVPPIRYPAISTGLWHVRDFCQTSAVPGVHMPRMGSGLAGGDWSIIERLIQKKLCDEGVPVTVYDLP